MWVTGRVIPRLSAGPDTHAQNRPNLVPGRSGHDAEHRWWRLPSAQPLPSAATGLMSARRPRRSQAARRDLRRENFLYWYQGAGLEHGVRPGRYQRVHAGDTEGGVLLPIASEDAQ